MPATQRYFHHETQSYTRIHSGPFTPWIKYVGLPKQETLTIRLVAAPRASGYRIWRYTQDCWWMAALIGGTEETGFDDTNAALGVVYFYWVQATNAIGASAFSSTASGRRRVVITGLLQRNFDGDGKSDPAIYHRMNETWQVLSSLAGYAAASLTGFGGAGSEAVPGDYDGDGKTDPSLYQESSGLWVFLLSGCSYAPVSLVFGGPTYLAIASRQPEIQP